MTAYRDVRIFKSDLQALCDSLAYNTTDSVLTLFQNPIVWQDTAQLLADTIDLYLRNEALDKVHLKRKALVVTSPDLLFFNQVKGKDIFAYFDSSSLQRTVVIGNAEAVYFAQDEAKAYIGVNKTACSEMVLDFDQGSVQFIRFLTMPSGRLDPMTSVSPAQQPTLEGFRWEVEARPAGLDALFWSPTAAVQSSPPPPHNSATIRRIKWKPLLTFEGMKWTFCGLACAWMAILSAQSALPTTTASPAYYDSLRLEGQVSAGLFLAQGNAYIAAGEPARAILAYERGLRLRPGHPSLANNRAYAETLLEQQLPALPEFILLRYWHWAASRLGIGAAQGLALALWWLGWALAAYYHWRSRSWPGRARRLLLSSALGLALILAPLCYALGQSRAQTLARKDLAILLAENAELRVAPGPTASLEHTLSPGLMLKILDQVASGYIKVALADGRKGWLPAASVEII
ncbi:MAG: SH3 domain-containing protein [Lewinella sp.]|nr:SH3 domain-containing protein [Lewinella sp.]